ncbi:hypothetical protein Tco_1497412, partial [Tanacetum coccineum]
NAPYYNAYLEMVAKHDRKVAAEKEGKKKSASTKQTKPKPAIEKSTKPAPAPKPKLVDKPDEEPAHSEPEPEPEHQGEEPVAKAIRPLLIVEGKGKAIVTDEQAAQSLLALHTPKRRSTTDQFILQRRTPTTEEASTGPSVQTLDDTSANIVRDPPSLADAEIGVRSDKTSSGGDTEVLQFTEELGEDVEKQENVKEKTMELDEDQTGSDPGETHESQLLPEHAHMDEDQAGTDPEISRVALARPDPNPTHDEFMADLYPKNLEDAYAIGDQFINDKSTEDNPGKLNVETEVVSMVTVLIYQASSSVPLLHTLLAVRVADLEKILSDLEQTNKNLDNTTRNLGSRVYTLELRDLPYKINEAVRENVKEAVQIALQAPL